jgi:hypothetical protein
MGNTINGTIDPLKSMITGMLPQLISLLNMTKTNGYIQILNIAQTISFNQLMENLTANMSNSTQAASCPYAWCGILPSDTFSKISNMI